MSLKERKLYIIEEFLKINDEEIIKRFENLIETLHKNREDKITPMNKEEFFDMIDQAEQDIKEGKIITQDELLSRINKWD